MINVEGHPGLVRDPNSNAIINTNNSDYQKYLTRRKVKKQENKKVSTIEEDLVNLKNEMNEIKSLLKELVNGN
tara:strand:- start:326 stop:544 length:219 start_codon:yes stop_codon:yes gene_type:complete